MIKKESLTFENKGYLEQMELVDDEPSYVQNLSTQLAIDQMKQEEN